MKQIIEITAEIDQALAHVFDIALKAGGLATHKVVSLIMSAVKSVPHQPHEPPKEDPK